MFESIGCQVTDARVLRLDKAEFACELSDAVSQCDIVERERHTFFTVLGYFRKTDPEVLLARGTLSAYLDCLAVEFTVS